MQLTQLKLEENQTYNLATHSARARLLCIPSRKKEQRNALCLFFGMPVPSAIECVSGEK
jgi:hypothetical protein